MKPERRTVLALSGAVLGSIAGCVATPTNNPSSARDGNPDSGLDPNASEDRVDPDVVADGLQTLVHGNTAFAFDLLDQVIADAPGENQFVSPFSISMALAMTWAGARSRTEDEMADVLRFALDQEDLHPAFNALDQELESRSKIEADDGDPFELNVANALWPREGLELREEYLDTMAAHYGARPQEMDFAGDPEEARKEINAWVADQTEGRIEDLIPEGILGPRTVLVLTNAIYFLAGWLNEFDEYDTYEAEFTAHDGTTGKVSMMSQTESFPYAEIDGHQLIELPYVGEETSMVVLLPAENEFDTVVDVLDADRLLELFDELDEQWGTIELPRFEVESSFQLSEMLREIGMEEAFSGGANFSGMVEGSGIWIEEVLHDAFVAVDEEGTEAAAATAVVMGDSGPPPEEFKMTVDRPFLFVIRDRPTDAVLFLGQVVEVPDDP